MSSEVLAAVILTIPSMLWALLAIVVVTLLYRPVRRDLLPRMGGVQAFGVELTFLREGLERIITDSSRPLSPKQADQVSRRAYRSAPVLLGAKVLWIDDHPVNNNLERRFLNSVGVLVDIATSSEKADLMIGRNQSSYDLVISDIGRDREAVTGIDYLDTLRSRGMGVPILFYVGHIGPQDKGIPAGAFGITDKPNELLNLTMDVLERQRG
jgi:CheY-like chemotaxis protein